jgi:hypothetical protein
MGKNMGIMRRTWIFVLTAVSLSTLWSFGVPSVTSAQNSGGLCVLNVVAEEKVLSIMVNQPQDFNIAVVLPIGTDVSAPVPCDSVATLALAVANQANVNVSVGMQILGHDGTLICSKGPFVVAVNGGHGVTFTDCQ